MTITMLVILFVLAKVGRMGLFLVVFTAWCMWLLVNSDAWVMP